MKLKNLAAWLLIYISVPIIGTGTDSDPYRADLPASLLSIRGIAVNSHIPSNPDGTPKFTSALVWVPDRVTLPKELTAVPNAAARATIISRDPKADTTGMERTK